MTRTVCVPSSVVRETDDKREATHKLGYIARAAVVFRVDRLVVFPDRRGEDHWGEGFVATVLEYAATPPYLRQEVWGQRDELGAVGVLPPLRVAETGSGPERSESLREGIVTEVGPDGRVRVNCGLQHPISLLTPSGMMAGEGERVTVRISSREPVRARITGESPPGFLVRRTDLDATLARPNAGVRIATSRFGESLSVAGLSPLTERVAHDGITVAFGAPGRGLADVLGVDPADVSDGAGTVATAGGQSDPGGQFDRWLNTIPNQGSEVVRTEEALFATLACLNLR